MRNLPLNSPETEHQLPGEAVDASGEPTLRQQVSSGVFWSGTARIVQQVIQFGLSVVLARLLSPDDYGLLAMVLVFTGFAGMLAEFGFSSALVQKKVVTEADVSSAFWMTVLPGAVLTGLTILIAPLLARFYHKPELTVLFQVVALNFVIGTAGNVPSALLQKKMRFRTLGTTGTAALLISGIVGVVLALAGFGVWSLVAQTLVLSALTTLLRWFANGWFPIGSFDAGALREMWSFSANLFGFNFINYWARNADNLLIGKYFGAGPLGIYNRAYALMLLPITQINSVIGQVIFPAFAAIQNDKARIRSIYLRAMGIITLLAFPIMFGLIVTARPFVQTVYGEKWIDVYPILQILGFVGICQTVVNTTGWLYLAQGRTDRLLWWGTVSAITYFISFIVGIFSGSVINLAICYAVANTVLLFPSIVIAGRMIDLRVSELIRAVTAPFLISCAMALSLWMIGRFIPDGMGAALRLGFFVVCGAAIYITGVWALNIRAFQEAKLLLREKLSLAKNSPKRI